MSAIHDLTSFFRQLQIHTHRQEPMSCHGKNNSGLRALGPQVLEALKLVMLSALLNILKSRQPEHQTGNQNQNRDAGAPPPSNTSSGGSTPSYAPPAPSPSGIGPMEGHKPSASQNSSTQGSGQGPAPAPAPSAAPAPAPAPAPSAHHPSSAPSPSPAHAPAPAPAPTHASGADHKPQTHTQTQVQTSGTTSTGAIKPPNTDGLEVVVVNKPIVIKPGENFDGSGKLYVAGPGLKGGGTAETADPVFIVGPGAKMNNVAFEGGDGIHLLHDAKLNNVHAIKGGPDDMITIDGPGNQDRDAMLAGIARDSIPKRPAEVSITNSTFQHSHDKAIQINGDANLKLDNIYAKDVGQLAVTLGGAPIEAHVSLNNARLEDVRSHTFRFDSARSSLTLGDNIDMGPAKMSVMMGDPSKVQGGDATVRPTTDRAA